MPSKKEVLDVDGIDVSVSNPDKVFFPKTGHTKLDLVRYYLSVADMKRFGIGKVTVRNLAAGPPGELARLVRVDWGALEAARPAVALGR